MAGKKLKIELLKTGVILLVLFVIGTIIYGEYLENKYPWHLYENNSYKLLDDYSGEGITIAFLDTGLDSDLIESFGNNIVSPYNIITKTNDIEDKNGHGTEMICVCACDYHRDGIYGLANKANIMPIVVMDESGRTEGKYIHDGIIYAVDNGADIINLSLGSRIENDLVKEAIDYAYVNDVIVVSSVGDYQEEKVLYPAKYESVIAVQSQSKLGVKYKDASWGNEVDILIPGEFIQTIGFDSNNNKISAVYESGSSISTAYFSSIVAIMIQDNENHTINNLLEYINNYEKKNDFIDIYAFVRGYR